MDWSFIIFVHITRQDPWVKGYVPSHVEVVSPRGYNLFSYELKGDKPIVQFVLAHYVHLTSYFKIPTLNLNI